MSDPTQNNGWWQASDGKWYPPQEAIEVSGNAAPPPPGPVAAAAPLPVHVPQQQGFVLTIGDIGITPDYVVTPNGNGPLAGSQWILTDRSMTTTGIPTWAIVMAILFAVFCLLGLFFLLAKETNTVGYVEVSVRAGGVVHMTQLPVHNVNDIARYRQMVGQAQSLAAQASAR